MAEQTTQSESMLVRSENLDRLLYLAGNVIVASSSQEIVYRSLQNLSHKHAPVDRDTLESMKDLAETTSQISSDLHRLVQAIRTVSLKDFSFRARRLLRDIARKTGKRVRFEVEGEETTVDKAIIERLYDPVSHQLRNAVDHGIEDALVRRRAGKPEEGLVVMRAYNTERETVIEIEDDGAGVNADAIRDRAISLGRIDEGTPVTNDLLLQLMCAPGISTSESVTKVSGRGVGMDVVMNGISDLGGTVSMTTERGKGSTFTFRIPLVSAVNIMDALVVRSGAYNFAFPIASVITTMAVPRGEIPSTLGKGRSIKHLGHLLPLQNLNGVLDRRPSTEEGDTLSIIVVEHKGKSVAFVISEFLSPQKLVIIPFDETIAVPGLIGTTVLGGRQLGFIVDVPTLVGMALGEERRGSAKRKAQPGAKAGAMAEATGATIEPEALAREALEEGAEAVEPGYEEEPAKAAEAREFMVEVEKLLPSLSEAVFALESEPGNRDQVNLAFRLFHTIKGNFIMMGLTAGGETVHSVESVLDRVRSKELEICPEVMDVLMDGVSYVEEAARLSKAGQWEDKPSDDILAQCAELLPKEAPELKADVEEVATAEIEFTHAAGYRATYHRRRRTPFYQLYVEFDSGMQPSFLVACLIYKRVCELGDILGTAPPLPDVEKGAMQGRFKLLFASTMDPGELEQSLVRLLTKHYGATQVHLTRFE